MTTTLALITAITGLVTSIASLVRSFKNSNDLADHQHDFVHIAKPDGNEK